MDFSAAILAGGRSSRFGQDKAGYIYKQKPLLCWVATSLSEAAELFVIANQAYPQFSLPVHSDIFAHQGPLSGIHAGLSHAKYDWLAVAACDMPYLNPHYWQKLLAYVNNSIYVTNPYHIVIVEYQARLEPLAALYHKACLNIFAENLEQKNLSLQKLLRQMDTCIVPFETLELDPKSLKNINYLSDLDSK